MGARNSSKATEKRARSAHAEPKTGARSASCHRIFLLSPANASGLRAKMVLESSMRSQLSARVRGDGAPLGEIFAFISGLYFRGKLAYAQAFAAPPAGVPGVSVITASGGLVPPDRVLNVEQLREISAAQIHPSEARYRVPLLRDGQSIRERIDQDCDVILLGSIATPKYVEPLLEIFGERLLFPAEFVGRGDMSRGGLMLRCARAGAQLTYIPVLTAVRHGSRPPRLPKIARAKAGL